MTGRRTIDGAGADLTVRVNPRARRISLKVDAATATPVLVLPSEAARAEGLAFARERARWLESQIAKIPAKQAFVDGAVIPYLGTPHRICGAPERGGAVWRDNGRIFATGRPEHLSRRVTDWFKAEARGLISAGVSRAGANISRVPLRITLRDPRTRWGSCSAAGALSFSWRLVMAPKSVLDYVVAHEVAHLEFLDHSPRFWALVRELHPGCESDRRWLRTRGAALHRYG